MHAVKSHGATKITMNSQEQDYQQRLRQARAQGDGNPFVSGIQAAFDKGPGNAVSGSRTHYGNSNVMPNSVMQGLNSNFEQKDAPANTPLNDPMNQSGDVALQTSATKTPQQDPEEFETRALDRRLAMYAQAGGNAFAGHNDRTQTMRLG